MTNHGSLQISDSSVRPKKDAYRKGDKALYKQAKYTLEKEIRVAKRNYSDKLRIQFFSSDSASVWKGLKEITNYKTPSPSTVENQQQADDLNEFYSNQRLLFIPKTRRKCRGDRTFSTTAPRLWNDLPMFIRMASSVAIFKSKLKTYLFDKAFYPG